jgi:hypothetical protein
MTLSTTNRPTTVSAQSRRMARTTLTAGVLALAAIPFGAIAVANATYKESDFASCLERDMPTDYCCEHAGGVMRNGACINPDDLLQPSGGAVLETQPNPPKKFPPIVNTDLSSGTFVDVQPAPPTRVPSRGVIDGPVLTTSR